MSFSTFFVLALAVLAFTPQLSPDLIAGFPPWPQSLAIVTLLVWGIVKTILGPGLSIAPLSPRLKPMGLLGGGVPIAGYWGRIEPWLRAAGG